MRQIDTPAAVREPVGGAARLRRISRRSALGIILSGAGVALVAACAPQAPQTSPPAAKPAEAAKPTAAAKPAEAARPAAPAPTTAPLPIAAAPNKPAASGRLQLPTYVPIDVAKPDLPGTAKGVDAGYLTFPKQLVKTITEKPGRGGEVNILTRVILAPPTPLEQNTAWQEINKQVGATLKMNVVPNNDYAAKLATTIAGGDIPDMLFISTISFRGVPQFLERECADLTPFLSGDAVKEYPHLANIPTLPWRSTIYNNRIYGVPVPRPPVQGIWFINENRFEQVGTNPPKDGADFKRMLRELTKPAESQWGMGGDAVYAFGLVGATAMPQQAMFKVPNNWRVDGNGKFVKEFETEEFKAAVAYVRDLWDSGVYVEGALTTTASVNKAALASGKFTVYPDGWFSWGAEYWDKGLTANPPIRFRTILPFSHDGSPPIWHQYHGFNGMTVIKKGDPERVKEMLRILNYLAAPFGSQEALLLEYGIEGTHFTRDAKGNPILTPQGKADTAVPWRYVAQRPQVLFNPNDEEFAKVASAVQSRLVDIMVGDPSLGLDSATNQDKGGLLQKNFTDALVDIVVGRQPLGALDSLVADWRSAGGDTMRAEFEKAYAASKA